MKEGFRRIAILLRWLSSIWAGCWVAFAVFSGERAGDTAADVAIAAAFILAPSAVGFCAAWIIDGFVKGRTDSN